MPSKKKTKIVVVREHSRHVPTSKKNPSGLTIVDQHLRHIDGRYLDLVLIEKTFENYDKKKILYPGKEKLFMRDEDKYSEYIAVWVDFFNKKLNLKFLIDPDMVKALIASESTFNPNAVNMNAKGLTQITTDTLQILQDLNGESKDFIFNENEIRIPYSEKTLANYKEGLRGSSFTTDVKLNQLGKIPEDYWNIAVATKSLIENIGYPTQKPEALLERIVKASSNKNDLVADFFVGSGTTLAVAEKLGRKWIGSDLGKFAIHTTRKRMINVQRELKKAGKDYRAFEILNLGKYERQHYIGVNPNLRDEEKQKLIAQKEKDFVDLILKAYKAEATVGFKTFHGKKSARLVAVGPVNLPVTRLFAEEVIGECIEKHITKADILAFEFEMGLFPNILDVAKNKGVDLALKYIPPDVFDKRAVEKNQVVFYDVAYIEVKPHIKKNAVAMELTDFSVFYNQDSVEKAETVLKNGGNKIVVENGQIIKISKSKDGIFAREVLTKKWTDWIDYWAVDFNFESKKEVVRIKRQDMSQPKLDGSEDSKQMKINEYEEVWTGDYIFENEWQSFRTKKDRSLELKSIFQEAPKGRRKIAVKVVDIFGNDTMKVIEITV